MSGTSGLGKGSRTRYHRVVGNRRGSEEGRQYAKAYAKAFRTLKPETADYDSFINLTAEAFDEMPRAVQALAWTQVKEAK